MFTIVGNVRFRPYYTLFYVTSMGVAVPLTYIINRDVTKEKILTMGWNYGIRSVFIPGAKVSPNVAPNVLPLRNVSSEPNRTKTSKFNTGNRMPNKTSQVTLDSAQITHPIP